MRFVLSPSGTVVVDPYVKGQTDQYISYYRRDVSPEAAAWTCYTDDDSGAGALQKFNGPLAMSSGNQLLTYRIAVAATGEYTAYHGGTVALGLAAIVTAVNRISGIFEQEFCIRLQLVANNNLIVYTNSSTDPYTGNNNSTMLSENQDNIDSVIGSANYDVGHVFSTAGGGVAHVGRVCGDGWKAQGASGLSTPVGDGFAVEIAAHEMGHQFGSHHTWNGTLSNCSADQWSSDSGCEPGSGSTIMGYAGLCGADNLQGSRDYYYHAISYQRIRNYCTVLTGANCPTLSNTGNQAPTVNAGPNYTIPRETPFVLTAIGSDPNGDPITYCWDEVDVGPQAPLSAGDNGSSPIFRSWLPTDNSSRTFPRLSDLLNNTTVKGEVLPTTNRTLLMRCTVRDNRAGGGGVGTDDTILAVMAAAGPFAVSSPNSAVTWSGTQTVTWSVANTNVAPVSCANVNILLSTNGGLTFPTVLASNTPNDGTQTVTIPNTATDQARIKVQAVGNIFFDISNVDFSICSTPAAPTNVSASDGTYDFVYLTWTLPSGEPFPLSHLEIWRNTTNNSATATRIEDHWSSSNYYDATASVGTTYYYWLKVANTCGGLSGFSASDSGWAVLAPPTNVAASDGTFTSIVRITWTAPVGASYYRVFRNTTNNSGGAAAISSWQTPQVYNDTSATPGATYYYWVKAATSGSGGGASNFSVGDSGWGGLEAPASVSASDGTYTDRVEVTTPAVTGASYYRLYHGITDDSSQATTIGNWQAATTFADTSVIAGRTYYFWTKAATGSNGERASGFSPVDAGWRKLSPRATWRPPTARMTRGFSVPGTPSRVPRTTVYIAVLPTPLRPPPPRVRGKPRPATAITRRMAWTSTTGSSPPRMVRVRIRAIQAPATSAGGRFRHQGT